MTCTPPRSCPTRGSIDWLCFPRFDSPACFAALLGDPDNGRWLLAPLDPDAVVEERSYRDDTFTLETLWRTSTGLVRVVETMPVGGRRADIVRRVEGLEGVVRMRQELVIRFGYGRDIPWVRRIRDDGAAVDAAFALPAPRPERVRGVGSGPERRDVADLGGRGAGPARGGRPGRGPAALRPAAGPGRPQARRRVRRGRGRSQRPGPHLVPVAPPAAGAGLRHRRHRPDRDVVAGLGLALQARRPLRGPGPPLPAHPAGPEPRGHGRHRRGAHDVAARGARRGPQLGLPLLLAARRRADAGGAARPRLPRERRQLALVAAPLRRGRPRGRADHVRRRRRAAARGVHARPPARLRGLDPGAGGQRGRVAAAGRRHRRGHGRAARRPGGGPAHRRLQLVAAGRAARPPGRGVGRPGQRDLGDPGRPARVHALADHGVGRVRPRGARGRGLRPAGSRRGVAGHGRHHPRAGARAGRRPRAGQPRAVPRRADGGRRAAPGRAGRLPGLGRPGHARHGPRGRGGPGPRRARAPLPDRDRRGRPGRRRAPVPRLLVLAGRALGPDRAPRGGRGAHGPAVRAGHPRARPARGGVRPGGAPVHRQLPAGVQPPRPRAGGRGDRRGARRRSEW